MKKKKIAVIGSGISGLSCAWKLSEKFDVELFECEKRFGCHSNTVEINEGKKVINVTLVLLFLIIILSSTL